MVRLRPQRPDTARRILRTLTWYSKTPGAYERERQFMICQGQSFAPEIPRPGADPGRVTTATDLITAAAAVCGRRSRARQVVQILTVQLVTVTTSSTGARGRFGGADLRANRSERRWCHKVRCYRKGLSCHCAVRHGAVCNMWRPWDAEGPPARVRCTLGRLGALGPL